MAQRGKKELSADHKAAMAQGRAEARVVDEYLNALATNKPKRGRKRTPESITKRLEVVEREIPAAKPIKQVHLIQERMNLREELVTLENPVDITEVEKAFIAAAGSYSERQGITYAAWIEAGVPAKVLKAADISKDPKAPEVIR